MQFLLSRSENVPLTKNSKNDKIWPNKSMVLFSNILKFISKGIVPIEVSHLFLFFNRGFFNDTSFKPNIKTSLNNHNWCCMLTCRIKFCYSVFLQLLLLNSIKYQSFATDVILDLPCLFLLMFALFLRVTSGNNASDFLKSIIF